MRAVNSGELLVDVHRARDDGKQITVEVKFSFEPGHVDERLAGLYKDSRARLNSTKLLRYDSQAMGLHMAAQIVRALGGEVITAGVPVGTMGFRMEMEKVELRNVEQEKHLNTKLRVLIVEDNPVNRKLIEMMFNSLGLSSEMAENGQEALDMVKAGNFHMVFMDLQMPVMDGIEATRRILEEVDHRPVIIALTANSTEDDRNMAMDVGMNDFMTKPLKINELRQMIIKWQSVSEVLEDL